MSDEWRGTSQQSPDNASVIEQRVSHHLLAAGFAAPIGPPLAGFLLDHTGQAATFTLFAALTVVLTIVMHLSPAVRTMPRPGADPQSANAAADSN